MKISKWLLLTILFLLSLPITNSTRPHYVYDNADVIDSEWEMAIDDFSFVVDSNTTAEIVCITLTNMGNRTMEETKLSYFNDVPLDGVAGIGKADKDNGILLLIAMTEREWGIEVGYGLEGQLTDAECGRIGRDILTPKLKDGKVGEGIYNSVVALAKEIGFPSQTNPNPVLPVLDFGWMVQPLTYLLGFAVITSPVVLVLIHNGNMRIENSYELISSRKEYDVPINPRRQQSCEHCGEVQMGEVLQDKTKEVLIGTMYTLLFLSYWRCLKCGNTMETISGRRLIETVQDRILRKKREEEEERQRQRQREQEVRRRRERSRSSSDYSGGGHSSGGSFGGGASGGGGAVGKW